MLDESEIRNKCDDDLNEIDDINLMVSFLRTFNITS